MYQSFFAIVVVEKGGCKALAIGIRLVSVAIEKPMNFLII